MEFYTFTTNFRNDIFSLLNYFTVWFNGIGVIAYLLLDKNKKRDFQQIIKELINPLTKKTCPELISVKIQRLCRLL